VSICETPRSTIQYLAEELPIDIVNAVRHAVHEDDIGMLTTVDARGFLHTRPMLVRLVDENGMICFLSNDPSLKTSEIRKNPQVSLSFQSMHERGMCALSASARISRDHHLIQQLWKEELREWIPQGLDDQNLVVLELTPELFDLWTGPLHTVASRVP